MEKYNVIWFTKNDVFLELEMQTDNSPEEHAERVTDEDMQKIAEQIKQALSEDTSEAETLWEMFNIIFGNAVFNVLYNKFK